jgi:hypothetical protein
LGFWLGEEAHVEILQFTSQWHLVSWLLLVVYRREWVRRNIYLLSMLVGSLAGGLVAFAVYGWLRMFL